MIFSDCRYKQNEIERSHHNPLMAIICKETNKGFTIVELIVTIAIMGIFLTLSFVSFEAYQANARDVERKGDVETLAKNLETYYAFGSGNAVVCPEGYIGVPSSAPYNTGDFCVMKYEAKDDGDGWLHSAPELKPWTNITRNDAVNLSANSCPGCHLMTGAEWMTIAQNVLKVPANWSNDGDTVHQVGTGFIYQGHTASNPGYALEADSNDANGTYGMTSIGTTAGTNTKRTLILTNGEVIWDFSANVAEWISGDLAGGTQPGLSGETAYSPKEWDNGSLIIRGIPSYMNPTSTGISGITWNSSSGIGKLYSNYGEASLKVITMGSYWGGSTGSAGVLAMSTNSSLSDSGLSIGFRVAYQPPESNKYLVKETTGQYPSLQLVGQENKFLEEIESSTLTAPNQSVISLIKATNAVQTTSSVMPQPSANQYVYQPLQADGSLCENNFQKCTKFNLYYRLEADNQVYVMQSKKR